VVLAESTERSSLLPVFRRSKENTDRMTRVQLPSRGEPQERDPRRPRRRKENCANDGERMFAMRDDVGMGMRG